MPWRRFAFLSGLLFFVAGWVATSPGWAAPQVVSEEETTPFPGIRVLERVTDEPNRIFAVYVSLEEPDLKIDATEPTTSFVTVADWAERTGALVAVNADFMRFLDGVPHLYGDAVGGGKRWPIRNTGRDPRYSDGWFYKNYGWIAFGDDWVEHSYTSEVKKNPNRYNARSGWKPDEVTDEIPEGTCALVSGFSTLVVDGEPIRFPTDRNYENGLSRSIESEVISTDKADGAGFQFERVSQVAFKK